MQQRVVADRIARLSEEAAAIRIGRAVDGVDEADRRQHAARATEMRPLPLAGRSPLRARVGSWLVSVGLFVAGPPSPARSGRSRGN